MSRARVQRLISFFEEITFRALACFDRFTYLAGITRIPAAIPCGNYDKRLLGETSYLARVTFTLRYSRPDEFFRPRHICETATLKIAWRAVILKRIYMIHADHLGGNILCAG